MSTHYLLYTNLLYNLFSFRLDKQSKLDQDVSKNGEMAEENYTSDCVAINVPPDIREIPLNDELYSGGYYGFLYIQFIL